MEGGGCADRQSPRSVVVFGLERLRNWRRTRMKAILVWTAAMLMMTATFGAPGKGRGHANANAAANVSNAPAGTPHASVDRDLGRDRAIDVGKGKKNGLRKTHRASPRANRS